MTSNRNLKRRVRERAAKTGESYAAALRQVRPARQGETVPELNLVRLATAQIVVRDDPRDSGQLRQSGHDVRDLMRQARRAGARIIHFPEGATCSPHKRIMSVTGPTEVGAAPADWSRVDWQVLRQELAAIARLAGELRLWTVLGSVHPLTPPHRPHNSMYVISDRGELVTRYDERLLSSTKLSFMYTPGSVPVTFEVDGLRFGCAMGIEAHFPEVWAEYERLDVDGVLFSTGAGQTPDGTAAFATEAQGHAATNSLWVSFAMSAQHSAAAPAGIIAPDGRLAARCPADGHPALAIAGIDNRPESIDIAVTKARPWRRRARDGIYAAHMVADNRSEDRGAF
ncbi:MAG: carbon-nitrogen hydrolase family protein [Trebonia sp.]